MSFMLVLKIVGGAGVISLVLSLMSALNPQRRLWMSEAAYARRRTVSHILISWAVGWVVLAALGILMVRYVASFGPTP
jgi:hypothetical protein